MNTKIKTIKPTDIAPYFGILQIANMTEQTLEVQADQIETKEGTKYTIRIKTPKPEKEAEECLVSA